MPPLLAFVSSVTAEWFLTDEADIVDDFELAIQVYRPNTEKSCLVETHSVKKDKKEEEKKRS